MVYALGSKGMQLVWNHENVPHGKLDWSARKVGVGHFFLEHTLAVADVLTRMELACRSHGIEFLHVDYRKRIRWSVSVHHERTRSVVGLVPDAVFGIKSKNNARWFFLEADRGTMPVERKTLKQTSFFRKLLAYHETWKQQLLHHSFPRFQVLTVTSTPEHLKSLIAASQRATGGKGSGLFVFVDQAAFKAAEDVFQLPLVNGRGEEVRLWP
jgi:hypothetical protein